MLECVQLGWDNASSAYNKLRISKSSLKANLLLSMPLQYYDFL